MNYFKTFILLAILTALFMVIGYAIGGTNGAIIALVIASFMNFLAYWNSDKLVLNMSGATLASKVDYSYLYTLVEELTLKANLPTPKLYIIHSDMPNAFATGRNPSNAAVAVTTGILTLLNNNELKGVLAHELAHVKNRDTLISTIAATFAGAISMIANIFMFTSLFGGGHNDNDSDEGVNPIAAIAIMFLAPIGASIIQMTVSRQREYAADKFGGKICGNPLYLASALNKLEQYSLSRTKVLKDNKSLAHMYIYNYFGSEGDSLFSTHPSTQNRILALEKQAKAMGITEININDTSYKDSKAKEKTIPDDYNIPNNPWAK